MKNAKNYYYKIFHCHFNYVRRSRWKKKVIITLIILVFGIIIVLSLILLLLVLLLLLILLGTYTRRDLSVLRVLGK